MPSHRVTFHDNDNLFLAPGTLAPGLVTRTPLYIVRLEEMADTEYGMVRLGRRPFQITLNCNMTFERIRIALVHELMHVFTAMHKIDLSHEQLHTLALIVNNDVVPCIEALDHFANT
jgi:hypothetical protein